MLDGVKGAWERFKRSRPGERFCDRYRQRQADRRGRWVSVLWILLGVVLLLAGVVALFVPGPGLLGLAFGAALIGQESERVAEALDAGELRGRAWFTRGRRWWTHTSTGARFALVLTLLLMAGGSAYGAWLAFLA
ncbi:MAG: PGPGW domain-containing protein [Gemmatimonadota bacterium]